MKISTRVEYGILALTDIAMYSECGSSVSAPDIAVRQNISHKYLEQILIHLRQAGLIRAQKGLHGGYTLSRPADRIRLSCPKDSELSEKKAHPWRKLFLSARHSPPVLRRHHTAGRLLNMDPEHLPSSGTGLRHGTSS